MRKHSLKNQVDRLCHFRHVGLVVLWVETDPSGLIHGVGVVFLCRCSNRQMAANRSTRPQRWYLGGIASAGAAACTHPLDLLKVCNI